MNRVVWAGGAWVVVMGFWALRDRRLGHKSEWLNKENFALLLALLGTVSIAPRSSAEELLRDPVVFERVLRGAFATLSLLVGAPILINRLRVGPPFRGYLTITAMAAYVAIATISIMYSSALLVTTAKAYEMTAAFVAVAAAALAKDGHVRLRLMVRFVMALLGGVVVLASVGFFVFPTEFAFVSPYRPGFAFELTMVAPYASANELSALGALFAAYSMARLLTASAINSRAFWAGGMTVGLAGIVLSSGRQGVAMFLVAGFLILWFQRRALFLSLIGPGLVGLVWLNWERLTDVLARGQATSSLARLTGRLPWWEAAITAWTEHPFTGFGFGAGGRFVGLASIGASNVSNVHSGYLEALVGVGLIGIVPLVMAIGLVTVWSLRSLKSNVDSAAAILIVPMAIHTFLDLGFGGWLKPDFILLLCLAGLADWSRTSHRTADVGEEPAWIGG